MKRINKGTIALIVWILFCAFSTVWMAQNLMSKAYQAGYAEGRKNWEVDVAAGFERGVEKGRQDAVKEAGTNIANAYADGRQNAIAEAVLVSVSESGYEISFGGETHWYER